MRLMYAVVNLLPRSVDLKFVAIVRRDCSSRQQKPCRNVAQMRPAVGHFQLALAPCQPTYSGFSIGNMSTAIGGRVKILSHQIDRKAIIVK